MKLISINQKQEKLTIPPNSHEDIDFVGSYIAILTNSTSSDVLVCADRGMTSPVKAGLGFPTMELDQETGKLFHVAYSTVRFINPTAEPMTIEYLLSLGPVNDTRSIIQGFIQVDLSAPAIETPGAIAVGVGAAAVVPSDMRVKERVIQNTGDFIIWYGGASVDPATKAGNFIYPGGSATVNCWGAVYLRAEGGASTASMNNTIKVM